MSKGTASLLLLLAVITSLVVIIGGLLTVALGGADGSGAASPGSSIWYTLMHTISTGVLTKEEGTIAYLAVMTLVTLTGMFITSFLIGTISNGIKDKVSSLQRGRSRVIETGHTIVIGFDENNISILEELVLANENKNGTVVIIADKDKVKMEEVIKDRLPDTGNLRIVCRSGQPDSLSDLKICSLDTCRAIIINLSDDVMTMKTILVCESLLDEYGNSEAYITATIRDREVLRPAKIAGGERAEILNFQKTIARDTQDRDDADAIAVFQANWETKVDNIRTMNTSGANGSMMRRPESAVPTAARSTGCAQSAGRRRPRSSSAVSATR